MTILDSALQCARNNQEAHLEELQRFLAIPSISTLTAHKPDVEHAARWLADQLKSMDIDNVEVMPTGGHPIVYGEWLRAEGKPVVLVYGHYDVQPADPLDEWETPPFEPTVRGDELYARGVADMKGQIFALLKAVGALHQQGPLPVNLKFLIEGEEEVGSPHLGEFIDAHREKLDCDAVLNCDAGILTPEQPSITYALRGLAYFELEVRGPSKDLHSGLFGGVVHNPAQALCELLAGMHDDQGRVTLPGFYDKVRDLGDEERAVLAQDPTTDQDWLQNTGAPALWGEAGYTATERVGARPTLDVNGLISGFTGEGSKTVLPAKALAKISMRLVADQNSADVHQQLLAYLRKNAPKTITWEVRELVHGDGAIMNRNAPAIRVAAEALEAVFGAAPVFKREGGSIPVVALLQQKLGVDTVMLGFSLPTSGIHGPNEKLHLPCFFRGIETYIRFLTGIAHHKP